MKVLQLKLNHWEAAQNLLQQRVRVLNVRVAIISEQYRNMDNQFWKSDTGNKASLLCRYTFQEVEQSHDSYLSGAKVRGVNFYSYYVPLNVQIIQLEEFLYKL